MGVICRLTTPQVAALAGIGYRRLDEWLRSGLLTCEQPAGGKGSRRAFDFGDLLRVRVVVRLREAGISLQQIRTAVDILSREWQERDPLLSGKLVVLGDALYYAENADALWHILKRQAIADRLVMLDVGDLAAETEGQVREACAA